MRQTTIIPITSTALISLIGLPAFSQPSTLSNPVPSSASERLPYFTFVNGTVSKPNGNQFILERSRGAITVSTGQYAINLAPNESISVTGTLDPRTGRLNAFSITRSTGTNITFQPNGIVIQPPIPGVNEVATEIRRVQ